MALELLIGAISAREEGGAEDDPSDSGAHENQTQGKSLAQQDAPPVFWKRLSKVLPGSGRNPAIETARIILGCRLPAFQAAHGRVKAGTLTGQLPEELLLIHVILECFAAVDEDNRNFVVKLPPKFDIGVDVDFAPRKTAPARKLGEAFLYHFTKVAPFSGVHDDVTRLLHVGGF